MAQAEYPNEPIAVVGSGCRFPGGASTPSKLWDLLKDPVDVQSRVPKDRFDIDGFYHPDGTHHGRTNAPYAYFLQEDLRPFDSSFFNIQSNEADSMDPQQRLLLETVYEAVENGGMRIQDLQGTPTAVYVGMMTHDYETVSTRDLDSIPTYSATGVAVSIASNRVSYFFDWHGPSMTIDTACSSSLAAVHLAVQQLRSGQSSVAIAAGANLILGPMTFVMESKLNMISPNGRSRMWDADADGYARGEGVCAVVLKTLSQALRDGDQIDCVIRETGLNQDGRTTGITMPSHDAQEALIRSVYDRAGLDITKREDRCQFFEAHGTGTPAGDPQEAEAIASAFFRHCKDEAGGEQDKLFVGGIKTVIGHTEGTAGIAGLLKASLAVQHGIIPPNMMFDRLSPRVAPFYKRLRIVTEATPWPAVAPGQPRRASVNSFGFGGTNAHAIIEQFMDPSKSAASIEDKDRGSAVEETDDIASLPFVFSAKSQKSLKSMLANMLDVLDSRDKPHHDDMALRDIASTLLRERSVLPFRRAVVGHNKEALQRALQAAMDDGLATTDFSTEATDTKPRVLGVFTGQGAQWPGMLKALVQGLPAVRAMVRELDHSLQTLPERYRPAWTLEEKLDGDGRDVAVAQFSQPLCCAAQVVLVRLLAAAGVRLAAVVGHSSGEIACAFAAGLVSAAQAIRIAYLRGVVSARHAASPGGQAGAMLAAGMSYADAQSLCRLDAFEGRVRVAACNSQDSVTFSGDADGIEHVQGVLEDESKFARALRVDKAYHSHHMFPCAEPYIRALEECGCTATEDPASDDGQDTSIAWYSSVDESNVRLTKDRVTAEYWKDNLVSPVLFYQAVQRAVVTHRSEGLDVAVEVGPHPALKGPCLSTIKEVLDGVDLPYTGCLERGKNDLEAFAAALGYLWERFGIPAVDAARFTARVSPGTPPKSLAKRLPSYPWDHSRRHWVQSRKTRQHLHGPPPHLLLGKVAYHTATTVQWANFIRPRDLEWLDGHALQGQTVFPAAGYIVMALEAALQVLRERDLSAELLEIVDMGINKAVVFEDENSLVEFNLTLEVLSEPGVDGDGPLVMSFVIDSCLARESELSGSANGQIIASLARTPELPSNGSTGTEASPLLPSPEDDHGGMNKVNPKAFYRELDAMGYDYSKDFRCLETMRRADARARGTFAFLELRDQVRDEVLVLHPAPLDMAFQTVIGAYSAPGDRRLRSLYVPTHIDRLAVVPSLCRAAAEDGVVEALGFDTLNTYDRGDHLSGDIVVFDDETKTTLFQVDNIVFQPLSPPTPATDHRLFSRWVWGALVPDALLDDAQYWATAQDKEAMPIIERIVLFYVRTFLRQLTGEDRDHAAGHFQKQIEWFEHVQEEARSGGHLWYEASWENDTPELIQQLCKSNAYHPHVRLVQRVGENLHALLSGSKNSFELMDHDGLLAEFYANKLSFGPAVNYARELVSQIAHRFPSMDILEIGAGTGGATKHILSTPQLGFNSYTFTDISTGFFENARERFAEFENQMEFKQLDIRRSPAEQGFQEHSYDLIIASNVLHATPSLKKTLSNARSLLKPGGHLVILEITHRRHTRLGFLFGMFPDWWAGVDDGRVLEPFVSMEQWDALLKQVGFSGIDSRTLDRDADLFPTSVLSSHAVDDRMQRLYAPLSAPLKDSYPPLVLVGGDSPETRDISEQIKTLLSHRQISSITRWEDVLLDSTTLTKGTTFVVLADLDRELFAHLNEDLFEAVKAVLSHAENILWLTHNAWVVHPNQASSIGMLRSVRREHPDMGLQVLDVDTVADLDVAFLAEQLLRLEDRSDDLSAAATWTDEPEIYCCGKRAWIPRLKHDNARNDRMNSTRRPITGTFDPLETPLALQTEPAHKKYFLRSDETHHDPHDASHAGRATIRVRYSLPKALRAGHLGHYFVVQGSMRRDGDGEESSVVALADTNASVVSVPEWRVFALPRSLQTSEDSCGLLPVAAAVLAATISQSARAVGPGAAILVLDAPAFVEAAVAEACGELDVEVYFLTTKSLSSCGAGSGAFHRIKLHRKETDVRLKQTLPANSAAYFDLSADRSETGLGRRLGQILPQSCLRYSIDHLWQDTASPHHRSSHTARDEEVIRSIKELLDVAAASEGTSGAAVDNGQVLPVKQFVSGLSTEQQQQQQPLDLSTSIIDWKTEEKLVARISPIDSGRLFVDSKTYLLVGLTGDLGRSLCRWMILHGARHVVLTSRNPQVDPRWIAHAESLGGHITVLAMDIADEKNVDAGLDKIKNELRLPPIGGIAFGPLVLQDVMLKNMDFQSMDMVLKPKVQGARILHERFSDVAAGAPPLDFFVMFSSIVAVMGNPGQANYSAANAFLQGLAQQRRACGLAGSTIDIGAVYGVGFVTRAELEEDFNAIRFMFDSVEEHELHTLFGEAVVAGRQAVSTAHDATKRLSPVTVLDMADIELTTGIPDLDPALKDRIVFYDDARVGHFKIAEQRGGGGGKASGAAGSLKERLLQATDLDQVREIVIDGLSEKLRVTLQIPDGEDIHPTIPLIDQGVDSLGAGTIGSWFSKQLYLDLPLLKVLGGASVSDLADEAAERLSPDAIPLVVRGESESEESGTDLPTSDDSHDALTPTTSLGSSPSEEKQDLEFGDKTIVRRQKLSLAQEYSWRLQNLVKDPTVFNNTIGMFMKGAIDVDRLAKALRDVLQRHEAFRTGLTVESSPEAEEEGGSCPLQTVFKRPNPNIVQVLRVEDREAAMEGYRQLQKILYNLEEADSLRLVDYHWGSDEHLLVVAYQRLFGDGSTTENLFVEAGQLYNGATLPPPTTHFADLAARQRQELERGGMDDDIAYWVSMHSSAPAATPLPLLLPLWKDGDAAVRQQQQQQPLGTWHQEEAIARLDPMVSFRIKERSRKHKATPMQFYLAAYHVLLARLASQHQQQQQQQQGTSRDGDDDTTITIGIADTNRTTMDEVAAMGFFANLLPLRFGAFSAAGTFSEHLVGTRDRLREAIRHARVPYGVVLDRLGLDLPAVSTSGGAGGPAPLFQAVFDYKQGQAESGAIGGARMTEVVAARERTPYDVVLEMSDDPTRDPLVTVKLQGARYGPEQAQAFLDSYVSILSVFSMNPALKLA